MRVRCLRTGAAPVHADPIAFALAVDCADADAHAVFMHVVRRARVPADLSASAIRAARLPGEHGTSLYVGEHQSFHWATGEPGRNERQRGASHQRERHRDSDSRFEHEGECKPIADFLLPPVPVVTKVLCLVWCLDTILSMMTRTVAYLRVSTDKQADHGVSLAAQRAKVAAYASLYDLTLVDVIVDAGESAKSLKRPGLQRALSMLADKTVDALLVVKLDRLTRSVKDLGTLVDRYFSEKAGSALMSVSEQIDTRTAAGRLVLNVLGAVSQWEREAIGERTSAALQHKANCGEYTGGEPPYGWRVSADGVTLEIHDGEQEVIRAAQKVREAGLSLRKVGAELTERGMLPRSGKNWHAKTVRTLLTAKAA